MAICKNCNQSREYLEDGICFICKRIENQTKEVKNTILSDNHGKEVFSKTGKLDENKYLSI